MYVDAGDDASAYASFHRALSLSPQTDAALESLTAAVAERSGRLEEALQRYETARKLEPIKTAHRVRIANVLLKQGELDEAQATAQQVVQEDGSEHEAQAILALVALERGQTELEIKRWESAWLASPRGEKGVQQRRDYAGQLARRLIELGRPGDAARTLLMLDEEAFFHPDMLALNAEALDATGLTFEAGRYYENWWKRDALNATAAAEAARWYLRAGERGEAQRMLNELRKIDAGDGRLIELEQRMRGGALCACWCWRACLCGGCWGRTRCTTTRRDGTRRCRGG
jgi:tetratricopeptide (TPR) repeat protein